MKKDFVNERTFTPLEDEYRNLKIVADILTMESPNKLQYELRDCYLDAGQNWMWTTICYENVQVLSPADWQKIVKAENFMELTDVIDSLKNGKYWKDK